jgi:hypothetical protein
MLRTPAGRITLAAAISVLLHVAALWLPEVNLPRVELPLPPLSAKLQPLPKLPPHHAAGPRLHHTKPKARPLAAPPETTTTPVIEAASSVPPEFTVAASAVVPASETVAASAVAAQSGPAAIDYTQTSELAPALPKHARLRFAAYLGTNGLYVGEVRHELEIDDGHYTLRAELETAGLARLFKRYQMIQQSHGEVAKSSSLQPDKYAEERTDEHGTQRVEATFDWPAHQLSFPSGAKAELPPGSQDILSFLYQLSQLPYDEAVIPLAISNGKKLEAYRLEVGAEEEIVTPMGKLRALHLSKMHGPNEEGLEIWLGMEYRLLPIKFRQIERNGDIAGEIVIKEIRVADE